MKKIISMLSIISILAISLFCFTGCGSDTKKKENSDNKANNETNNEVTDVAEDENILNNNDSYFFIIDGKKFKAGDKITDLESVELSVRERELEEDVPANKYMIGAGYIVNSENKSVLNVTPYNTESSAVKVPETHIGGFTIESSNIKNDSRIANIEVCGGIKLGSTEEEVKKVFGEPSSVYEGQYWDSYTYKSDEIYRKYELRFDKEERTVTYISWQNLVFND